MRKNIYLILIIIILACNKTQELKSTCPSFSIVLLQGINREKSITISKNINNNDINFKLNILKVSQIIDSLALEIINECGGLHPTDGTIMQPCKKGNFTHKKVLETKILNGYFSVSHAHELISKIMRDNAKELFKI